MSNEIELPTIRPGKSIALIALGMGAYFLYLYIVGFEDVLSILKNVDLTLFVLAIALALIGVLFDALAWQAVAQKFDYKVPLWDIFLIYMSCNFMNNLIPSGSFSGETARVYFLEKLDGGSRIDPLISNCRGNQDHHSHTVLPRHRHRANLPEYVH